MSSSVPAEEWEPLDEDGDEGEEGDGERDGRWRWTWVTLMRLLLPLACRTRGAVAGRLDSAAGLLGARLLEERSPL